MAGIESTIIPINYGSDITALEDATSDLAQIRENQARLFIEEIWNKAQHSASPESFEYAVPDKMTQSGGENSTINEADGEFTAEFDTSAYVFGTSDAESGGTGSSNSESADYIRCVQVTPVAGTVKKLGINVESGTPNCKLFLYDDNAGSPGNLVAQTNGFAITGAGWNEAPTTTNPAVTATTYWLGVVTDGNLTIRYTGTGAMKYESVAYASAPSDPFTPSGTTGNQYNMRVTTEDVTEDTIVTNSLAGSGSQFWFYPEGVNIGNATFSYKADGGAWVVFTPETKITVSWSSSLKIKIELANVSGNDYQGGCLLYS
jgi:hypothetical protein